MLKSQWAIKLKKGENTLNLKFFSRGAESLAETVAKPMATFKNEISWSKSRDETFKTCPRQYWFAYYGFWNGWLKDGPERTWPGASSFRCATWESAVIEKKSPLTLARNFSDPPKK
jgi:hypothetical protein